MGKNFINQPNQQAGKDNPLRMENWMIQPPAHISVYMTVREAAEMMVELDTDVLPVLGDDSQPAGIATWPILGKELMNRPGKGLKDTKVGDLNHLVNVNDSLLDLVETKCSYFNVVNDQNQFMGILSKNEILKGFTSYFEKINEKEHSAEILPVILESAYEGIAVVDENGILREFNHSYSRFTGISQDHALGRHVEDVIDNTRLPETLKTGMPERGVIQYIQGQPMIVHRIPIWKEGKVVGAIGMLIFEGVTEVYRIYERLQGTQRELESSQKTTEQKQTKTYKMTLDQIIGDSERNADRKRLARKVAKTSATVLITGESGTGKELFARGIHHLSSFSSGPFVPLNCGAIPEQLFESEMFGYEEGAFTGARKGGKPGKFELAQNGTLFLDEIGEMPLMMQAKLLRVLQEKQVERVGGTHVYNINTRIIAATNRNLKELVEEGEFREDLYYRLNILEIPIPPLRDRPDDVPPLVSYYLKALCKKYEVSRKGLTSEAMAIFMNYEWPGNIRELINTLEKLVVMVDEDMIDTNHLPEEFIREERRKSPMEESSYSLFHQVKNEKMERERDLIEKTLKQTDGNKTKAAQQLGIHRTTLYQKLKKYRLE
ncbi:PAS domain S-box-containing protein [Halobacillus karajensis]|uniref:sigma-54-dependent Fis family transcriptional regulator n=1 Tax=Halobacillus karajensis TaxID=195088 RepID=UPI0008A80E35|nr:sigma-54-dependent Fis family transcriptional regulator [Halobacillus karajensis]SEI00908.1 PAS domain S-box-containing protein [Halobacillus karajensis]